MLGRSVECLPLHGDSARCQPAPSGAIFPLLVHRQDYSKGTKRTGLLPTTAT